MRKTEFIRLLNVKPYSFHLLNVKRNSFRLICCKGHNLPFYQKTVKTELALPNRINNPELLGILLWFSLKRNEFRFTNNR